MTDAEIDYIIDAVEITVELSSHIPSP
jgi:hypothetical protein